MLIRNRIADIDISENIDLESQLRHFCEDFDGHKATWDLRFDDTSRTIKILQIVQSTCWNSGKNDDGWCRANIRFAN